MPKPHTIDVRIYYEDTDAGGVVYYANYLKYCERGRTEFLRQLGFEQDELLQQNIVFAVRQATIDFKQAAKFNDELTVITEIESLKKVSVIFKQTIQRENDIICQAIIKIACLKAKQFTPTAIPLSIMSQLTT